MVGRVSKKSPWMCAFRNVGIAICQVRRSICSADQESERLMLIHWQKDADEEGGSVARILWNKTLRWWSLVTGVYMRGMRMPICGWQEMPSKTEEGIASMASLSWQVRVNTLFSPEMHSNINGDGEGQSLDWPKVDLLARYKIRVGARECWSYLVTDLCQSQEWKK